MPQFGKIEDIAVVQDAIFLDLIVYKTVGIDRHFHSFVITKGNRRTVVTLSELMNYQTFNAHLIGNNYRQHYITFRSHIEKL